MNGNNILLDTNIILYYLSGDETLIPLLEENNLLVSIITEIELLGFNELSETGIENIKLFLSYCIIENISDKIKNEAITLRRSNNLKLPDAIIFATARTLNIPFITADKHFAKLNDEHIIIYE